MRSLFAFIMGLSPAAAQYLVNDLSFGYDNRISPNNDASIPGFSLQGKPNTPEVLSNRVILTPPAPGNQRAAIWAENALQHTIWTADVDFRANGPERAGGNLNIWLVKDGAQGVGTSSIYTVGKFEGLALVIDTYGGGGGMVRGFLNDGSKDYNKISVDGQSFGNCDHAYRNLGRPSQIKFRQTTDNFKVEIDGQLCFESNKIRIPAGYKIGLTAASADNPDSFEIFKLVVMTDNVDPSQDQNPQKVLSPEGGIPQAQEGGIFGQAAANPPAAAIPGSGAVSDNIADADAGSITSSAAQFADLHTRLQSVTHHIASISQKMAQQDITSEARQAELKSQFSDLRGLLDKLDKLDSMERKITNLEGELRRLKGDVTSKVTNSEKSIKSLVADTHTTLHETVKAHASSGHGRLIAVIIGSQVVLGGAYIVYKRRKSSPKKYL
ncbi:concanavalin A-like lectin/glucanase domain-containing protein [Coniella lustricola]|uniref:Concanavalin A-like lectin/glucanase domain-containing protein n=1 Tax=Coniella lustricola TaxID=2025994 RepID=A0A2T3AMU3_9PEZI|nr:concanavalin A-like lectin/glucanase domain-containing protein [Coniella lustricola]